MGKTFIRHEHIELSCKLHLGKLGKVLLSISFPSFLLIGWMKAPHPLASSLNQGWGSSTEILLRTSNPSPPTSEMSSSELILARKEDTNLCPSLQWLLSLNEMKSLHSRVMLREQIG